MFQKSSSKRPREEASFRLSTEEQSWKEYHFFVGQILSYVSTDNCYNQIEVVEISDDEAGNINSIKVRYYGWHQDFDRLFDEWIDVRDEENCKRFGKFETGVHRVKCFFHLPGLPYWPCMGLIREPASDDGLIELRKYNQMYVEVRDVAVACLMSRLDVSFPFFSFAFVLCPSSFRTSHSAIPKRTKIC